MDARPYPISRTETAERRHKPEPVSPGGDATLSRGDGHGWSRAGLCETALNRKYTKRRSLRPSRASKRGREGINVRLRGMGGEREIMPLLRRDRGYYSQGEIGMCEGSQTKLKTLPWRATSSAETNDARARLRCCHIFNRMSTVAE